MTISSQIPNNSKNDLEAPKHHIFNLRALIHQLEFYNKNFTAKNKNLRGLRTRFKPISIPPDLRGLILRSLIYEKYGSLEPFAKDIGKTKMWVHYLIYKPEKVKMKPETNQKINEALGIEIIF